MNRLLVVASIFAAASSCTGNTEAGLLVSVAFEAAPRATCIGLEVQQSGTGAILASTVVAKPSAAATATFALRQGDLPGQVNLQAVGYAGTSCNDASSRTVVTRSELQPVVFPTSGLDKVALTLGAPNATIDADRDGFVDVAKGGTDCDDTKPAVYPGAPQACDATVDLNCDGKVGCAEPGCSTTPSCLRPVTRLVFSASPQAGVATFDCSPPLTVESADLSGPTPVAAPTTVTFVGSLAGTSFFSDAQCTQATSTAVIATASTSATVYMRATTVGTQTVTATAMAIGGASVSFQVRPQPVSAFSFEAPMVARTAGDCFSVSLRTVDAAGRPTGAAQALTATLASNPSTGTTFYEGTNTSCSGSAITAVTFLQANAIDLRVRATRATPTGTSLVLRATAASVTEGTLSVSISPGAAHQLYFASQAPGPLVNTCSGPLSLMTVGVQDLYGNPTTVATATSVTMAAQRVGPGTNSFTFYTDSACTTGLAGATLTIPAGQAVAPSLAIRATEAAAYDVTATASGLMPGTQRATIANAPPSRIALLTMPPVTLRAGECSMAAVQVETRDSSDFRSAVTGATLVVEVSSSGGVVSFFSDASCTTPLAASPNTSISIPVSSAEGQFYMRGTLATSTVVTVVAAAYPAGNNSQTLPVTVSAGAPFALRWLGTTSQTRTPASCSAAYTLEVQDAHGNPTRFTNPATLSTTPSEVTVSTSPACAAGALTFPTSSSQLSLYAQATVAGTYPVTAATTSAPFITSSAPQAELVVTPGAVTQLVTTAPAMPASVVAGQCVAVTVERRDAQNNPVPVSGATTFTLNAAPATGLTAHATQGDCQGNTNALAGGGLTVSSGAQATFWVRATRSPSTSLSVTSNALTSTAFTLTVNPAAATQLVWTAPATLPAGLNAGACVAATLERRDAFGNAATDASALAVQLSRSAPSMAGAVGTTGTAAPTAAFAASSCGAATATLNLSIGSGLSSVGFLVTSATAGSMVVTPGSALATNAQAQFNVFAGSATQLVFTATPGASMVAGACAALTFERRDASNNAVSFTGSFTLTAPAGVTAYASANDCTNQVSGSMTLGPVTGAGGTFYVRPTAATNTSLTVTDSTSLSAMTSVNVTPDVASVLAWSSATPSGFVANACQVLTLERRDRFGNFSTSGGATLSVDVAASGAASATVGLSSATDCSSPGSSTTVGFSTSETSKTFSARSTTAGTLALTPTTSPALTGSGTAHGVARNFTIAPGPFTTLALLATPTSTPAGTCVANTVELRDAYGNVTTHGTDVTVNFSTTLGGASFTTSCTGGTPTGFITIGTSQSTGTFGFSPTTAPTTTIQAQGASATVTQNWSISAGPLSKLVLFGPDGGITAGACSGLLTVQAQDTYNNPVPVDGGMALTLAPAAQPGLTFFNGATACTGGTAVAIDAGANFASFSFQPTVAPASFNVTAGDGVSLTSNPLAYVVSPGSPNKLAWKVAPPSTMSRFVCAGPFTVQTQDSQNNPTPVSPALSLALSASAGVVQFYTDSMCTTSAVSSTAVPDATSETTFYAAPFGPGTSTTITVTSSLANPTVTTTPTLLDGGTPSLTVTSLSSVVEAGGCQAITVTRRDGENTPVTLGTTSVTLSSNNAALTVHTDVNCTATGPLTIASGASSATGYVAGHSSDSASVNITAADGASLYGSGVLALTALPLVRRGSFTFSGADAGVTVSPDIPGHDISRTFLVFQATADEAQPSNSNVECRLASTGSSVGVNCSRYGNTGTVTVNWQTASWGRSAANGGVSVQHRSGTLTSGSTHNDTLPTAVTLANSFVLFNSASSGTSNSVDDFATAALTSTTNLQLVTGASDFATGGFRWNAEVVQFAGATVQRPSTVLGGSGTTFTRTLGTAVSLTRSVPIYTMRISATGDSNEVCKKRLRGRLVANMSNTDFTATRGNGATVGGCDNSDVDAIAFEAVEFPVGTAVQDASDGEVNNTSINTTITSVAQHRTLLFLGGHGPSGGIAGEGDREDSQKLGASSARLAFNSNTQISVTRASGGGSDGKGRFTPYVIQFAP